MEDSRQHAQPHQLSDDDDHQPSRHTSGYASPLRSRRRDPGEFTGLLSISTDHTTYGTDGRGLSTPTTPRRRMRRQPSHYNNWRQHSRHGSFAARLSKMLGNDTHEVFASEDMLKSSVIDDRAWYDQFTSTDWVRDSIADALRIKEIRSRKDFRGRLIALYDACQGWILVALIGCVTAAVAYLIDVTEAVVFDYKKGYCRTAWYRGKRSCCGGASVCDDWTRWSSLFDTHDDSNKWLDFAVFNFWVVCLALISCWITLQTKTTVSSAVSLSTLDENLAALNHADGDGKDFNPGTSPNQTAFDARVKKPMSYYPAAGSGVAEVKVILSGFVLHGYLGVKTIIAKSIGLVFSVGSGLSVGKEGPYVHVATCIGNIACRIFTKYRENDGKRREVLSASAASGVAVAFGAPISGVLFSLEEVSYYFPPKTLFRTFFCCIVAALSLKFLNPYGTRKIVLFEVRYNNDWRFFEMIVFIFLGLLGGFLGAMFIKASRFWARTFRRIPAIKQYPMLEVALVAIITGLISFWNRYSRLPVAELLYELAAPCAAFSSNGHGLCPTHDRIPSVIKDLIIAFLIKAVLTTVTFGVKVPAGIYVPSMVVGGLVGRITGHAVQLLVLTYPDSSLWGAHPVNGNPESIVTPGVFALAAAGATMCGVTRLSVTLAVILFELTGSLDNVLPFSLAILVSKWTADALEPHSIYDLLTNMNAYPYLDAKTRPVFEGDMGDITIAPRRSRVIDISASPLIAASHLRKKLDTMHMAGEIDGGLPIIRDGIIVGLIPGPDLEFALDNLGEEEDGLCLLGPLSGSRPPVMLRTHSDSPMLSHQLSGTSLRRQSTGETGSMLSLDAAGPEMQRMAGSRLRFQPQNDPADFRAFIDPSPLSLDICSPMELVFECFVKLGLRYICVTREGRFAGLVHKKAFVKYVQELEERQRKGQH